VISQEEISCREAAKLISAKRDRPLETGEERLLTKHLKICANCERYRGQIDFIATLAKRYGEGKTGK
jgi:Putative zinc-finger